MKISVQLVDWCLVQHSTDDDVIVKPEVDEVDGDTVYHSLLSSDGSEGEVKTKVGVVGYESCHHSNESESTHMSWDEVFLSVVIISDTFS